MTVSASWRPITSSRDHPKSRSACWFQSTIRPSAWAGDERLVGGLEDGSVLDEASANLEHKTMDREAQGAGDHQPEEGANQLVAGRVVRSAEDQRRRGKGHVHPRHRDEQLRPRPVEREPEHRKSTSAVKIDASAPAASRSSATMTK